MVVERLTMDRFYEPTGVPVDLIAVGRVVDRQDVRGPVSNAPRLNITLDTFLTDLYHIGHWYLELSGIDDTEAVPRRSVMVQVVPIGNPATAQLSNHQNLEEYGRVRLTDFCTVPNRLCGTAPLWFLSELDEAFQRIQADDTQEEFETRRNIVFMSDRVLNGATIYVSEQEMLRRRPWM